MKDLLKGHKSQTEIYRENLHGTIKACYNQTPVIITDQLKEWKLDINNKTATKEHSILTYTEAGERLTSILDMPSPKKAHAFLTWAM